MTVANSIKRQLKKVPFVQSAVDWRRNRREGRIRNGLATRGVSTLVEVLDLMHNAEIESFAAFGTMLGIVRERGLIGHDLDVDTAFVISSVKDWNTIETALTSAGYEKVREFAFEGTVTEQSYRSGTFTFDVFGLFPIENEMCRAYLYSREDGEHYARHEHTVRKLDFPKPEALDSVELPEGSIFIPSNYQEYLEAAYGPNWSKPDPSYKHSDYWELIPGKRGKCVLWKS